MYSLHSWLRYAVFALGVAAFLYALWGLLKQRPYQKLMWDLASWFTLSLYLQIVIGFFLIFGTTNRFFDRTLWIHMVLSMVAAAVAQLTYSANRRRLREERTYAIHVWGVGLAMALVLAGILAEMKLDSVSIAAGLLHDVIERHLGVFGLPLVDPVEFQDPVDQFTHRVDVRRDPVERAILRVGAYELIEHPEIPYRVVINEAVELAKTFGAEKGHRYVNGVLDKAARTLRPLEATAGR